MWFDRHLVVSSYEDGTSVWDVRTGERLAREPGTVFIAYDPLARTFLEQRPDGMFCQSVLTGE